jgi:hypothetical protein
MKTTKFISNWLLIGVSVLGMAATPAATNTTVLHAAMPAGYEVVVLKPSGAEVSLLGLIECPELEGAQRVSEGVNSKIISADGTPMTEFPRNFSFRITASLRKTVISGPSNGISSEQSPQDFLMKLRFPLKVYDGLNVREIQPESVEMIGVPSDISYDERIYRVTFNLNQMPITDRFVLEVRSPEGNRMAKFHFDLL